MKQPAFWLQNTTPLRLAQSSRYNLALLMSSPLTSAIVDLSSSDPVMRSAAAMEIYRRGRAPADRAVYVWWTNPEFAALCGTTPAVTVGIAVKRATFQRIREANGLPRLVDVPPDQDTEEFELHFPNDVTLDVLTPRDPAESGPIARFLAKFGEGVQQVEFRCSNVERATKILNEQFALQPIYPQAHAGADNTRVNFFLVPSATVGKILIELYQPTGNR
jgi:hypothetical protein